MENTELQIKQDAKFSLHHQQFRSQLKELCFIILDCIKTEDEGDIDLNTFTCCMIDRINAEEKLLKLLMEEDRRVKIEIKDEK